MVIPTTIEEAKRHPELYPRYKLSPKLVQEIFNLTGVFLPPIVGYWDLAELNLMQSKLLKYPEINKPLKKS